MVLFHESGKTLAAAGDLQNEQALLSLAGCDKLSSAKTLGNYLRRTGSCEPSKAGWAEAGKR